MSTLSKAVNLGELKKVIEIQRVKTEADIMGFQEDVWETISVSRAKIEFDDRLMREVFKDDGVDSTTVKIFTFRYIPITNRDRIIFNGVAHEIYGFNNVGDENRFVKVWAREICQ